MHIFASRMYIHTAMGKLLILLTSKLIISKSNIYYRCVCSVNENYNKKKIDCKNIYAPKGNTQSEMHNTLNSKFQVATNNI